MSSSFVALAVMLYAGAQAPPPIPGTTGTLALDYTDDAGNKVAHYFKRVYVHVQYLGR